MRFSKSVPGWMMAGLLVFTLACGGGDNAGEVAEAPEMEEAVVTVDPAKAATITGKIKFEGEVPRMFIQTVNMSAEPDCRGLHETAPPAEVVVVSDGMLQNVFVWVKSGLEGKFAVSDIPAMLDQKGCIYSPHVLAVQAGQMVNISNSDPTTHNVHPLPKINREWNRSQPAEGPNIEYKFPRQEIMIAVKCNIHPWMRSYISVVNHPFFAVSGADGSFEIKGLPAGSYTVEAVHERFGSQEMSVTLGDAESKDIEFSYSAS